ncbi:hypothetical protein [Halogeometricum borinquense]|uniref:hypothetical protein n=1 Tax=Halogeometricum borinquense TaxID=60847 RepID=UPI001EF88DAC|nr:hypothetical protein [Halogeometricum borinquense]
MVLRRRRLLQSVAAASLATFAGCATPVFSGNEEKQMTYTLSIDNIPVSPVEHALYEPSDGALFGDPARTALDDIIPEGRHTTYGYQPLSEDQYVERNGAYYQTKHIVTGQKRLQRTLVRGEPLSEDEKTPDDAIVVESLDKPTSRVVKILHSNAQTGSAADLLRDDAYVLRRPAEQESALAAGELDGRVVTMKKGGRGSIGYRPPRRNSSKRNTPSLPSKSPPHARRFAKSSSTRESTPNSNRERSPKTSKRYSKKLLGYLRTRRRHRSRSRTSLSSMHSNLRKSSSSTGSTSGTTADTTAIH